ncbi:MAG TPA: NADH-quinone oxidoreductase subunit N [Phnomibacter sp.]|nr:NADH-quinone oxidoreductase subunit N [Phnomibacter sp.]
MNSWMEILIGLRVEMVLTVTLFVLLAMFLAGKGTQGKMVIGIAMAGLLVTLVVGFTMQQPAQLFGFMFRSDNLIRLQKNILALGSLLVMAQSYPWLVKHRHGLEYCLLLISALLGMFFMVSSGHLLMFYLGLELSTIPIAAMANFDLDKRCSSEAAFKMIVSSALASGVLLMGISYLYAANGTLEYAALSQAITASPLQVLALVLVAAGFGFKISAVPFHLWTADVYEGAPLPTTAFLSVISKGAVLFVLVTALYQVFAPLSGYWYSMVAVLACATMLTGNLFAMRQQNFKRFMAFSSIAQVGYMLVGISGQGAEGHASLVYFVLVYVFSNLAAFGVLALISQQYQRECIYDFRGFYKTHPGLAWALAIALFSLAGVPPMAGFFGKFFLILAGASQLQWWLVVVAALNMVISMYYYLRVVRLMFMDEAEEPLTPLPKMNWSPKLALVVCLAGILLTGLLSGAYRYIFSLVQ